MHEKLNILFLTHILILSHAYSHFKRFSLCTSPFCDLKRQRGVLGKTFFRDASINNALYINIIKRYNFGVFDKVVENA